MAEHQKPTQINQQYTTIFDNADTVSVSKMYRSEESNRKRGLNNKFYRFPRHRFALKEKKE